MAARNGLPTCERPTCGGNPDGCTGGRHARCKTAQVWSCHDSSDSVEAKAKTSRPDLWSASPTRASRRRLSDLSKSRLAPRQLVAKGRARRMCGKRGVVEGCLGRIFILSLVLLGPHISDAQFSFQVRFKDTEKQLNLPHVECGAGFPRDSEDASCQDCTPVCNNDKNSPECLCINQFQIATTQVDLFNGLDEDVEVCEVEDTNGNTIFLNSTEFYITIRSKSSAYNSPSGHVIELDSRDLTCERGKWNVQYTTTIAGQYIVSVVMKSGESAAGTPIFTPLMDADRLESPFERLATKVVAGLPNPDNYFLDIVTSFRPRCTAAGLGCEHCRFTDEATGTSCPGNDNLPAVLDPKSQVIVYPGDRFYNPVFENCKPDAVVGISVLKALKIPYKECSKEEDSGGKSLCREVATIQRDVLVWDKLLTSIDCSEDEAQEKPTEYYIMFTPSYSGYYFIEVKPQDTANSMLGSALTTSIGPLIIPVEAAAVDATKCLAYGNGIFNVIQSELATFTIQPMDSFGNHHTSGLHVFQVAIRQVQPLSAFNVDIVGEDTGKGSVLVQYQLQQPAIYEVYVRYCKDLLRYPPYTNPAENRICDLSTVDQKGPQIKNSPFRVTIRDYEFYIPLVKEPGLMEQFRTAEVGVRYFALFTGNFDMCGKTYGSPPINDRYNPIIRFDPAEMTYNSPPLTTPTLDSGQVQAKDVQSGKFASVRYASYAGTCKDVPGEFSGFVFTFMLTVSGSYNVWIYSDSTSYRAVAESPRTFTVSPDVPVLENFRGTGPAALCSKETDCMANQDTWLYIQAKDQYFNDAETCKEDVKMHVVPVQGDTDHYVVTNLEEFANVGGVPINGVPGPGITQSTRSGYRPMPIGDFAGILKSCDKGNFTVSLYATLSAKYTVSVTVNDLPLYGSPFDLTIYPQQIQVVPGVQFSGLVTVTRWTFYRVYLDKDKTGFGVEVVKTDVNNGQPWTYMRYEAIFADIQEPDETAGIRYGYPDARSSINCRACRIHVPPPLANIGLYYIAVYGFQDDSSHTVMVVKYSDQSMKPGDVLSGRLEPGRYAYYRFRMDATSGFQIRISTAGTTQGSITATLKKDDYPLTDQDPSSIFGQVLMQKNCQDCIIDHPPTLWGRGDWYLAVLAHSYAVDFQVALLSFSEKTIDFGSQSNQLTLKALTWGYYIFTIDADIEPSGFKLDVIPTNAAYNITTVLKKSQHPITLTDSTFKSKPCTHCRITVMTRQKLQGTWYIGVYAGATGGEFELKVKLMEACPNDCFGNGVCVQRKIKICRCFPGYTGTDCRDAIKEKVFAWYPLDGHAGDVTENRRPFFFKTNGEGKLVYKFDGLEVLDTYVIIPKPTPAISCSRFSKMVSPTLHDLQWGDQQVTSEGTAERNRVDAIIPEVEEWYHWNELGKPKGNPRIEQACAEYNPRREFTIMFHVRVDERGLSPGSMMTLGKPSMIHGRSDIDENGKWAWSFYPQPHPNGRHIVFDLYLRNTTHEISLREEEIYPIGDGAIPIFEKPDYWKRTFPNGWCIDALRPTNKEGTCKYMEKEQYYHVAAVFAPRRIELYVDATLVGVMKLDLWNITDIDGGRIQFGHDPRFSPYERLFFGQVRDIRILRYAASLEEISTLYNKSDLWFKWRESVRSQVGIVDNPGSWKDPIPLTSFDDGSLDPDVSSHAAVCQSFRVPNEPREMHTESNCPFIDTDTSWIFKETNDRYYRKHDTDRSPFGLGHEQLILLDTRPKQEVYLGRYYDFSIDEE